MVLGSYDVIQHPAHQPLDGRHVFLAAGLDLSDPKLFEPLSQSLAVLLELGDAVQERRAGRTLSPARYRLVALDLGIDILEILLQLFDAFVKFQYSAPPLLSDPRVASPRSDALIRVNT